jgi:hypothetical protein
MTVLHLAAFALFAVAAYHAVRMHGFDRRLQSFRAPDAPPRSFLLVPLRWREQLYTPEGLPLLRGAVRAMLMMYGWGLGALILFAIAGPL